MQRLQKINPKNKSWYEFKALAEDTVEIYLYDSVGGWFGRTAKDFVKELKEVTAENITLRINSPGGDVFDGFAIYNALRAHSANVSARVEGLGASIASVIALAADSVEVAEASFMMIHNPWALAFGDAAEMRETADVLDKMTDTIADIYAKKMDIDVEEVKTLMAEETWYSGSEAVESGLADVVYDEDEQIAAAAMSFNLEMYCHVPPVFDEMPTTTVTGTTTDVPTWTSVSGASTPSEETEDNDDREIDHELAVANRRLRLHEARHGRQE